MPETEAKSWQIFQTWIESKARIGILVYFKAKIQNEHSWEG